MTPRPRSRKLVRLNVQLRVVLIALAVASLVLLLNFQLSLGALSSASGRLTHGTSVRAALEDLRSEMVKKFLLSIGLSIPTAVAIGVLYSFKFAGPIHALSKYFDQLRSGPWSRRCTLRQGDDLQDLSAAINLAMDQVRGFLEENRQIHVELKELAAAGALKVGPEAERRFGALKGRMEKALAVFEARLPSPSAAGAAAGPDSGGAGLGLETSATRGAEAPDHALQA